MDSYSYTNLQLRTTDSDAVRRAIDLCDIGSSKMIARAEVNWISVYPFLTENDFAYLINVAQRLSNRVECNVVAFMLPKPSQFKYALINGDDLLDEYDSETCADSPPRVDLLLPWCVHGTSKKELEKFLLSKHSAERAGDKIAQGMSDALGIPRVQVCTGFNYLKWAQAGR